MFVWRSERSRGVVCSDWRRGSGEEAGGCVERDGEAGECWMVFRCMCVYSFTVIDIQMGIV